MNTRYIRDVDAVNIIRRTQKQIKYVWLKLSDG